MSDVIMEVTLSHVLNHLNDVPEYEASDFIMTLLDMLDSEQIDKNVIKNIERRRVNEKASNTMSTHDRA